MFGGSVVVFFLVRDVVGLLRLVVVDTFWIPVVETQIGEVQGFPASIARVQELLEVGRMHLPGSFADEALQVAFKENAVETAPTGALRGRKAPGGYIFARDQRFDGVQQGAAVVRGSWSAGDGTVRLWGSTKTENC